LDPRFKKLHFNHPLACSYAINHIAKWVRKMDQTNVSNNVVPETNTEVYLIIIKLMVLSR